MRLNRSNAGWRSALLLASGWFVLVLLLAALDARAEGESQGERIRAHEDGQEHTRGGAARERRMERWNKASEEERREMRAAAREFWKDTPDGDRRRVRRRLKALRRALPEFSKVERRMILRRSLEMPPAERDALRDRIMGIEELDPEARAELEAELRGMIDVESDEMHRIEENVRRWQKMTPEERDEMREQARRFRRLPIEDRRRLLNEWVPSERPSEAPSD